MRTTSLLLMLFTACREPDPDPGFGSVTQVFAAIEPLCHLGERIDKSPGRQIWDEAKQCTPDVRYTGGTTVTCRAELKKFAERRAVRDVSIVCANIRFPISARMMGDLAAALGTAPPTIDEIVQDPQPTRSLRLTWSDRRTYLSYLRFWSEPSRLGNIDFNVSRTSAFEPGYERVIGDDWEHLWNGSAEVRSGQRIDPDDL